MSDLAGCRELIAFGLPRYQFTARIVPEGGIWLAFSAVNDSTYALLFADRLLPIWLAAGSGWLSSSCRPTTAVRGATGTAAGACLPSPAWSSRNTAGRPRRFNPPHRSTYNSDVEAVHGLMEREFYEPQRFTGDLEAFLNQAGAYQLWFNYERENSGKGCRTPDQLRAERAGWVDRAVFALPPVLLSSLSAQDLPLPRQILVAHDAPGYVSDVGFWDRDPRQKR